MEPENLEGQWWLPNTPEHQRFGRIASDETWSLVVEGGLRTPPPLGPATGASVSDLTTEKTPLIYGRVASGESVTLVGCWGTGLGWPMEPQQETWHIESIVEGAHLADPDALMTEVRIRLGPLRAWTCADRSRVDWNTDGVTNHIEDQVLGEAHLEQATIRLIADHAWSAGEDCQHQSERDRG